MTETIQLREPLELYAVRSLDGKWFRAKGMSGFGESWVDDIKDAKLYGKISTARSRVTYWAKNYPDYGIPDIVVITVSDVRIMDEERSKAAKRVEKHKTKQEEDDVRWHKQRLKSAQVQLEDAQRRLDQAKTQV